VVVEIDNQEKHQEMRVDVVDNSKFGMKLNEVYNDKDYNYSNVSLFV